MIQSCLSYFLLHLCYFIISTSFPRLLPSRTQSRNFPFSFFNKTQQSSLLWEILRISKHFLIKNLVISLTKCRKIDNVSYKFLMHCLPLITIRRKGIQQENLPPNTHTHTHTHTHTPASVSTQFSFSLCVCTQWCPTLCNPMDCTPPGSSVHGIFQARILAQDAISYSRGSSWPRDQTHVSCASFTGRPILYYCATWEVPSFSLITTGK